MEIPDDRFTEFLGEFREFKGEVKARISGVDDHIHGVSKKADVIRGELQTHAGDHNAHQLGGERRGRAAVGQTIGAVLAAAVAVFSLMKALGFERAPLTRPPREEYIYRADGQPAPSSGRAGPGPGAGPDRPALPARRQVEAGGS